MTKQPINSNWRLEASRLLEKAKTLSPSKKKILDYFIKYISVGDTRAIMELEKRGIKDAEILIEELIEEGFIEKGVDCYNLSYPLRMHVFSKKI